MIERIVVDGVGVCRPLSDADYIKIKRMAPAQREIAIIAFSYGLTLRQFKRLPVEARRTAYDAANWMASPANFMAD